MSILCVYAIGSVFRFEHRIGVNRTERLKTTPKQEADMGRQYRFTVVFDQSENGRIVAKVPMLPGCRVEGNSVVEAEQKIQDIIRSHVRKMVKSGELVAQEDILSFPFVRTLDINLDESAKPALEEKPKTQPVSTS